MDVLDRREVEVLAPEEGAQLREKSGARRAVAGHGARLDEGGALPILAGALVIGEGSADRQRGRGRGGIGPQPQIRTEDVAVAGTLLHQSHQILRQTSEKLRRAALTAIAYLIELEQHDEVDIARIVELACAELAHAEHDESAVVLGCGRVRGR